MLAITLDAIATAATAVAAILAAFTIWQAKKQAQAGREALLHERRVEFQCALLLELLDNLHKGSEVMWVDVKLRNRASLLPVDLIPLTRAALGLPSLPAMTERIEAMPRPFGLASKRMSLTTELKEEVERALITVVDS